MDRVNATARGENDITEEATLMDMANVTVMAGVHSEGMERLREACEGKEATGKYMSVNTLSKELDLRPLDIYRLIKSGNIPAIVINDRVRIPTVWCDNLLLH